MNARRIMDAAAWLTILSLGGSAKATDQGVTGTKLFTKCPRISARDDADNLTGSHSPPNNSRVSAGASNDERISISFGPNPKSRVAIIAISTRAGLMTSGRRDFTGYGCPL